MTDYAAQIARELEGRRAGKEYSCRCPAHEDKHRSLSVENADNGDVLLFCHAGCKFEDIAEKLRALGVMPEGMNAKKARKWYHVDFEHELVGKFTAHFDDTPDYELVRVHPYRRQDGSIYKFKARFSPKIFKWLHKTTYGWKSGEGKEEHFAYRWFDILGEIAAGRVIHIPKGEKDVDTLVEYGLAATTPGGVKVPFTNEALDAIAEAKGVIIWADNDQKGLEKGQELCLAIYNRGGTCKLLTSPRGKDVSDWMDAGARLEDVNELIASTPMWIPPADQFKVAQANGELPEMRFDPGSQAFGGDYYAHRFSDSIKYVTQIDQWYKFSGSIWEPDAAGWHRELAKAMHSHLRGAMQSLDIAFRQNIEKLAKDVQTEKGVRAVISMARTVPAIHISPLALDAPDTKHLFNCASGIVNLRTGEIEPHNPMRLITKYSPFKVDYDREPTMLIDFLTGAFDGDQEIVDYLQIFLGYCLTGESGFQKFVMLTGEPGAGKSQLQELLTTMTGSYCANISSDSLRQTNQRSAGVDSDLAGTRGARVVFSAELSEKYKLDEQVIKALTGGDPIKVKFMRENRFDLKTHAKLIFTANERPPLSDDGGIARRLIEIRFENKIMKAIQNYAQVMLREEGAAILGWLIKGAVIGYQTEFNALNKIPEKFRVWTDDYLDEANVIKEFLKECTVNRTGAFVATSELFDCFNSYCKRCQYVNEFSLRSFGRRLARLGHKSTKNALDQRGHFNLAIIA